MQNELKYAVVFAGQGAQKPGMGKSLYEASAAARAIFDRAGDGIKHDCFEADAERLMQTEVTQPAVYTMDMAAYAALREALGLGDEGSPEPSGAGAGGFPEPSGAGAGGFPEPSCVAGFSLGEYAALTAAGVIDSIETGLELVRERSLLMRDAGTNPDGSAKGTMAAGMGDPEKVLALVEKARGDGILEAVNFNSPQQTVVAGDVAAVGRFASLAGEDRSYGVKAIPLPVSGAFHTPIMNPAAEGLAEFLAGYTFGEPAIPVFLNATGGAFSDYSNKDISEKVRAIMVRQVKSPVHWKLTIEAMAAAGIETVIEVGPGKTLSGLAAKTVPGLRVLHVEDAESLLDTVRTVVSGQLSVDSERLV